MNNKAVSTNPLDKNPTLARYIRPGWIKNKIKLTDEAFQLRSGEPYISFHHSSSDSEKDKINDIKKFLSSKPKGFNFSNNCGFILLNYLLATTEINLTNNIIKFQSEGYPHYGLYFLSDDEVDMLEAKTSLVNLSDLYLNDDHSKLTKA